MILDWIREHPRLTLAAGFVAIPAAWMLTRRLTANSDEESQGSLAIKQPATFLPTPAPTTVASAAAPVSDADLAATNGAIAKGPCYSLPGGGLILKAGGASATVSLFGAHVTAWSDASGAQRLWMSKLSATDGSAPIRGGVPIAFPQFADQGPLTLHGFARTKQWALEAATASPDGDQAMVVLVLRDDDATRSSAEWGPGHRFLLRYTVTLTADALRLELAVQNVGPQPFSFTCCLHPYFGTIDTNQVSVSGLGGLQYMDKVDGMRVKTEPVGAVLRPVDAAASPIEGYFIDRIYWQQQMGSTGGQKKRAGLLGRGPVMRWTGCDGDLEIRQSPSWTDTVVFNPWEEGKKGVKGPDFDDDGYKHMLCVEPAVAQAPLTLGPGQTWSGWQKITVKKPPMSKA